MYDIAIIGAGPAGATLARLIGSKYKVLLVDRRRWNETDRSERGKCCGGLLAPDAQKMLSRLGLGLPKSVLVEPQLFVVRTIDIPRRSERYYQRFYINMDRREFERWLVSMVPSCIDCRFGCRFKSYDRRDGGFDIALAHDGRLVIERARMIVGADGASSLVRRRMMFCKTLESSSGKSFSEQSGATAGLSGDALRDSAADTAGQAGSDTLVQQNINPYFSIQHWMESDPSQPFFSAIFDPEITDFYCWTIPKGELLLVGAALKPKDDASAKFDLLIERLRPFGFRFGQVVRREGTFIMRPTRSDDLSTGARGVALLGEAGGWISPSSAEGFSYAFHSALILSEVIREGIDGFERRYARAMRSLRWNLFLKRCKSRLIFNSALRNIAMRSGFQSIEYPGGGNIYGC
ncbi:MAG: oxidoreductase [Pirellulaceae bacterium]|nr:oxidoreductase [Pirellulaceae bacterium]